MCLTILKTVSIIEFPLILQASYNIMRYLIHIIQHPATPEAARNVKETDLTTKQKFQDLNI